jgi:hypothetical protein
MQEPACVSRSHAVPCNKRCGDRGGGGGDGDGDGGSDDNNNDIGSDHGVQHTLCVPHASVRVSRPHLVS